MYDEANSVFALVESFTLHLHSDELNEKLGVQVHSDLSGGCFVRALTLLKSL